MATQTWTLGRPTSYDNNSDSDGFRRASWSFSPPLSVAAALAGGEFSATILGLELTHSRGREDVRLYLSSALFDLSDAVETDGADRTAGQAGATLTLDDVSGVTIEDHAVAAGGAASWGFSADQPTVRLRGTKRVDAGGAAWDFTAAAARRSRPRGHAVDAAGAAWGFAAVPPTVEKARFQHPPGERFKRAQRDLSPRDVVLTALEITHPDLPSPVRVVNDAEDRTVGGETYVALRFDARLADDVEGRAPRAELVVDNIGRPLVQWIEAAGGGAGATVRAMQFVAGIDEVEWEVNVKASDIHVGQTQVRIALGYEFLLGRKAVRVRHDPETSPGIF